MIELLDFLYLTFTIELELHRVNPYDATTRDCCCYHLLENLFVVLDPKGFFILLVLVLFPCVGP